MALSIETSKNKVNERVVFFTFLPSSAIFLCNNIRLYSSTSIYHFSYDSQNEIDKISDYWNNFVVVFLLLFGRNAQFNFAYSAISVLFASSFIHKWMWSTSMYCIFIILSIYTYTYFFRLHSFAFAFFALSLVLLSQK